MKTTVTVRTDPNQTRLIWWDLKARLANLGFNAPIDILGLLSDIELGIEVQYQEWDRTEGDAYRKGRDEFYANNPDIPRLADSPKPVWHFYHCISKDGVYIKLPISYSEAVGLVNDHTAHTMGDIENGIRSGSDFWFFLSRGGHTDRIVRFEIERCV